MVFSVLWLFLSTFILSLLVDFSRTFAENIFYFIKRKKNTPQELTPAELAIVIPCHNSEDVILNTLASLPKDYTVICVPNACTDQTVKILNECKRSRLKIVEIEEPGKIKAVVYGVMEARKEGFTHFLLLDDDIRWKSDKIEVWDKEAVMTGYPVVPVEGSGFLLDGQMVEYQMMCIGKKVQSLLGSAMMASGAAGCYKIDVFLEMMKFHDGEHIGDDLQCSLIHLAKGYKIDFFDRTLVATEVPNTLKAFWKQRALRWEVSPIHNWYWMGLAWFRSTVWLKFVIGYRFFVFINDILRVGSFPIVLVKNPSIILGVFLITYTSLVIRAILHRHIFSWYYNFEPKMPLTFKRILLYPLYNLCLWLTRIRAIPKGLMQIYKYWIRGGRKNLLLAKIIS